MKKKNLIITTVTLFFCVLASLVSGQEPDIIGLWNMVGQKVGEETQARFSNSPVFKLIGPDGSFLNFNANPLMPHITGEGTYDLESDSVYVEHISRSTNQTLDGTRNELQYRIAERDGKRYLYLKFFIAKSGSGQDLNAWFEEVYQEVTMPMRMKTESGI